MLRRSFLKALVAAPIVAPIAAKAAPSESCGRNISPVVDGSIKVTRSLHWDDIAAKGLDLKPISN